MFTMRGAFTQMQFSPKMFSYGRNKFAEKIPNNLGFAQFSFGFSIVLSRNWAT
jgi:glucan biosynthesis protein